MSEKPSFLRRLDLRGLALLGAVVLLIAVFAGLAPGFRSPMNVSAIVQILSYTTVAALGLYLIILLGHIDLSIGSAMALCAGICCVLIQKQWSAPAAMGVAMLVLMLLYAAMGILVAWMRIPAFIVTLGGLLLFRGLAERIIGMRSVSNKIGGEENILSMLTDERLEPRTSIVLLVLMAVGLVVAVLRNRRSRAAHRLPVNAWWQDLAAPVIGILVCAVLVFVLERDLGVPLCFPLLGVIGLFMWFLANCTRFGRWCFAAGGNIEAARLSGIPVRAVTLLAFMITGVLASIAGFLVAAYGGTANPTTANLMELDAIAACVIGGVSLMGGRGQVSRVLLGALLIVCLVKGMDFLNLEPFDKKIVRGLVLVGAVWLDMHSQRLRARRAAA